MVIDEAVGVVFEEFTAEAIAKRSPSFGHFTNVSLGLSKVFFKGSGQFRIDVEIVFDSLGDIEISLG